MGSKKIKKMDLFEHRENSHWSDTFTLCSFISPKIMPFRGYIAFSAMPRSRAMIIAITALAATPCQECLRDCYVLDEGTVLDEGPGESSTSF